MTQAIFITATDTDAGKTTVTLELLARYNALGAKTAALKPIACGAELTVNGWRNADAQLLQDAATVKKSYCEVNPFLFLDPSSPNIAARKENRTVSVEELVNACNSSLSWDADYLLIEGAGGWDVPLNQQETLSDFVKALRIPVILVVAIKLGCINHALLTRRALIADKVDCLGWVANCCYPKFADVNENIATLQHYLPWPLLMTLDYRAT